MKNNQPTIIVALLLTALLSGIFYFMMPQSYDRNEAPLSEFSTKRALEKVKQISKKPHFIGSQNHVLVEQYLLKELQDLGLQTSVQEGFTMTEKGTLVKSKNILAKISGTKNSKALVLLSHYDSAPHSYSHGASDDASGVATILESVRAFLHNKTKHKNDIIILFTDAEEIGLNGAALFVTQHQWAKNVGLVLNFEARGSSGPSYMLMETNKGNSKMVDAFKAGNVDYPVSNSLMYSIYKMLPNDTDLTVFREKGKIQGFNFAFIDSHFNYHTARDNYQNLAKNTLAHQGNYLFALVNYFANEDLSNLNSDNDQVYFNIPFTMMSYPFSWIIPMLLVAFGLLILFTFVGLAKRALLLDEVFKGFVPFFGALLAAGLVTYMGWKLLLSFYPQYGDILHGFTYNGHDYVYAFVSLTLAICFLFYKKPAKKSSAMNQLVAPLLIWLLINTVIAFKLEGAGFLIIPVLCSTLMLAVYVFTQRSFWLLNLILSIPALIIIVPFITMFPVGLGLKILFGSSILTVLTFTLLLPVFGNFEKKNIWATLFFLLSIGMFVKAHQAADYSTDRPKPNSLVYLLNDDTKKANWATYDTNLDEWTKGYLGEKPTDAKALNTNKLYSKYGSAYTFMAEAPTKNIPSPNIEFLTDSIIGSHHFYKIKISPNRNVNRYDIFVKNDVTIQNLIANGVKSIDFESNIASKTSGKILSYYMVENLPLELEFSIKVNEKLDLELLESSFDLLSHPDFTITKRKSWMIPMPFVLTDAVIIKQKIKPSINTVEAQSVPFSNRRFMPADSLNIVMDSLK
ncbi:M20/M25/M40 family metallo-hydrolase [Flavobacterium capsici]|uniref:Vacuolar membrane protease n=1 Tax=Flavobacterium capsici TaxID=3075618 RepID=A0AA96EZ55_9FLAO|nr:MULTISPECIES: M20/M25/M40 family metallo-hydrolase [unclassified Flavobacterium]WNM19755.1 M20/M25/M40 family metallo-hydrolase [Flavobacterium sp. PMR2A8]WNM21144.1 M20/M25/M40 family metallo-hydrolase [Flavobacterium sp. PMTSA4]